jgi:hypothetical protein
MDAAHSELDLGVTAEWPLYLDHADGDADLSRLLQSTVDPPGGWAWINAMTYSSYLPLSWRTYYVYLVETALAQLYPDRRPSHLLGLLAAGNPGEPELDFDELVRDARLSRALGVPEIVIYKLTPAVLREHGDDVIRRLDRTVNETPSEKLQVPFSRPASVLVYGVAALDVLLDMTGWGVLVLLAWGLVCGLLVWKENPLR